MTSFFEGSIIEFSYGIRTATENFGKYTTSTNSMYKNSESNMIDFGKATFSVLDDTESMFESYGGYYNSIRYLPNKSNVSRLTKMKNMFKNLKTGSYNYLNLSSFNTENVTDMSYLFGTDTENSSKQIDSLTLGSNFDTKNVTNMEGMFSEVSKLTNLDLSSFDTSRVINMSLMFSFTSKLASLNLSNFNTSQVTVMNRMFANMPNLANLNLSSFDTSQVTEMSNMFYNTPNLTSLDLSTFDTSNVTDMNSIFALANSYASNDKLEKIYVNNDFNISKLKISPLMFNNRKKLRGGNGSFLANPSQADKSWLRIDDPSNSRPGYFTRKP